jgi:sugar-phosphatase
VFTSSPHTITVDAILFDNDGVLVNSHTETVEAWSRLGQEFGVDLVTVLEAQGMGARAEDTLPRFVPADRADAAIARLADLETELAPKTRAMAGAAELLSALPPDRWTVCTSACRRLAEARWSGAGLPLPERSITAEDVSVGKPDPQPFLKGAALLGFEADRCLVFEDSPAGGRAATAAGAAVVAVGAQSWPDEVRPVARIPDLRAVTFGQPEPDGPLLVTLAERTADGDDH